MDKFKEILNNLPEKPTRSRLDPYQNLIKELLRRGRTYREIAHILFQECGLRISLSTIHYFVHARSCLKPKPAKPHSQNRKKETVAPTSGKKEKVIEITVHGKEIPTNQEVYRRIAELKQRSEQSNESSKLFHYDPDEPLHITK